MLVYISLCFLDNDLQLLYARKLSNRPIPVRKRRKRLKRQMSYAISAVLYARPQGHFAKIVLYPPNLAFSFFDGSEWVYAWMTDALATSIALLCLSTKESYKINF